jgi:hypothetical protein
VRDHVRLGDVAAGEGAERHSHGPPEEPRSLTAKLSNQGLELGVVDAHVWHGLDEPALRARERGHAEPSEDAFVAADLADVLSPPLALEASPLEAGVHFAFGRFQE